ncbi:unnamed protein product [Symbiodinium sp. CCMP2592]|nr:unnamed protein product [Symbiodinium sp. CCMP2592]CAE7304417.1 unnamed protein product [Symbiodinium sp. CCMP2592]CAE7335188.1 unnamed protein product [Symbiodinium sp. CCMP2592]
MAPASLTATAAATILEHLHNQPLIKTGPADRHQAPLGTDVERTAEHLALELLRHHKRWRGSEFVTEKGRVEKDPLKIARSAGNYPELFSFACCFLDPAAMVSLAVPPNSHPNYDIRLLTIMYDWQQGTCGSRRKQPIDLWRPQQFVLDISFLPPALLPENDDSDVDEDYVPPLPCSYAKLRVHGTVLPPVWRSMSAVCKNWDAAVFAVRSASGWSSVCGKPRPRGQRSMCEFMLTAKRRRVADARDPHCFNCRPKVAATTNSATDTDTDAENHGQSDASQDQT